MYTVIDADKLVLLIADGCNGLLWLHHQREHFGVFVRIVWLEIRIADLPRTEKFLRVIGRMTELVYRSSLKFRRYILPNIIISTLQIWLSVVRNHERYELVIPFEKTGNVCLGTIFTAEPLVMIPLQNIFFVKMLIDNADIVL